MQHENSVLNGRPGETVKKSDGREATILMAVKIAVYNVDGKIEINHSFQNNHDWKDDQRIEKFMDYLDEIQVLFDENVSLEDLRNLRKRKHYQQE